MAIHLLHERIAGELTTRQEDLVYASRSDCERLQDLVDDLLDLSRMQSGKIQMLFEEVPAQTIIEADHGRSGVDSVAGKGSCFWFVLPIVDSDSSGHERTAHHA